MFVCVQSAMLQGEAQRVLTALVQGRDGAILDGVGCVGCIQRGALPHKALTPLAEGSPRTAGSIPLRILQHVHRSHMHSGSAHGRHFKDWSCIADPVSLKWSPQGSGWHTHKALLTTQFAMFVPLPWIAHWPPSPPAVVQTLSLPEFRHVG